MMSATKRYPIVLAHGIFRPDILIAILNKRIQMSRLGLPAVSDRLHYFRGIASYLQEHGYEVYHTTVSFAGSVSRRAEDLRDEITNIMDEHGHEKVHIIAHSMGGLDARHMIAEMGMDENVASLTTIGTPHLGAAIADWAVEHGMHQVIKRFRKLLDLEGVMSVTGEVCRKFNSRVVKSEAANAVFYQTYASAQSYERTFFPFHLSWKIIHQREGENDGLVSFASQKWCDVLAGDDGVLKKVPQHDFPIPADHLEQIGWWNVNELYKAGIWNSAARDERAHYEGIVKDIYLNIAGHVTSR